VDKNVCRSNAKDSNRLSSCPATCFSCISSMTMKNLCSILKMSDEHIICRGEKMTRSTNYLL
jgi:hypothetical protein